MWLLQVYSAPRAVRFANHAINLIDHFVERSYQNDVVLIALMKKLLPDKRFTEKKLQDIGSGGVIVLPAKLPVGAQSGNINAPEPQASEEGKIGSKGTM